MKKIQVGKAAKVVLLDHTTLVSGTITYNSSNTAVATVNNSGVVLGVGAGTSLIAATNSANGRKAAVMIEVVTAGVTTEYNARVDDYIIIAAPTGFNTFSGGPTGSSVVVVGTAANTRFVNAQQICTDPTTGLMYVADLQGLAIIEINPITGNTRLVCTVDDIYGAYGVTAAGNGKVYYSSAASGGKIVVQAIISTGVKTTIHSFGFGGNNLYNLTCNAGVIYVAKYLNGIYAIDTNNANATVQLSAASVGSGIAYANGYLYFPVGVLLVKMAITGGALTTISSTGGMAGGAADSDGVLYYITSSGAIKAIDNSGAVVSIFAGVAGNRSITVSSAKDLFTFEVDGGFYGVKKSF